MWTNSENMSEENMSEENTIVNRKQRYRKRVGLSPTQVYFNQNNESDLEAHEALEELKKIYGGEKEEKSKAIKEILKMVFRELKKTPQ